MIILSMLIFLINILTTASDYKYIEYHYDTLEPGYSFTLRGLGSQYHIIKNKSLTECAWIALENKTHFFNYNKLSQTCMDFSSRDILGLKKDKDNNQFAYYITSQWIWIYLLSMGTDSLIYESFVGKGNRSMWNVDECKGTICPYFYRSHIIDIWQQLPIDQVEINIYKNNLNVLNMVFDGYKSTVENWFSIQKLNNPIWRDLTTENSSYFSLKGSRPGYNFNVLKDIGDECSTGAGWFVIYQNLNSTCSWLKADNYPVIMYSAKPTYSVWSKERQYADEMYIYVRLKKQHK